ncbi:hypothetical protein N9M03_00650 [bacterium]|nr:hypothetical protein [bacterium]
MLKYQNPHIHNMNWNYWSLGFATLAMFASLAAITTEKAAEYPDYLDETPSEETLDAMRGLGASA